MFASSIWCCVLQDTTDQVRAGHDDRHGPGPYGRDVQSVGDGSDTRASAVTANFCPVHSDPAGACAVWLADLQLARPGRGHGTGMGSPQVAGDGSHEHHGQKDNR